MLTGSPGRERRVHGNTVALDVEQSNIEAEIHLHRHAVEAGIFDLLMYYEVRSRIPVTVLAERLAIRVLNDLGEACRS